MVRHKKLIDDHRVQLLVLYITVVVAAAKNIS